MEKQYRFSSLHLVRAMKHDGPEIEFGETNVLSEKIKNLCPESAVEKSLREFFGERLRRVEFKSTSKEKEEIGVSKWADKFKHIVNWPTAFCTMRNGEVNTEFAIKIRIVLPYECINPVSFIWLEVKHLSTDSKIFIDKEVCFDFLEMAYGLAIKIIPIVVDDLSLKLKEISGRSFSLTRFGLMVEGVCQLSRPFNHLTFVEENDPQKIRGIIQDGQSFEKLLDELCFPVQAMHGGVDITIDKLREFIESNFFWNTGIKEESLIAHLPPLKRIEEVILRFAGSGNCSMVKEDDWDAFARGAEEVILLLVTQPRIW